MLEFQLIAKVSSLIKVNIEKRLEINQKLTCILAVYKLEEY